MLASASRRAPWRRASPLYSRAASLPIGVIREDNRRPVWLRLRSTLSSIWVPTGGVSATENESGHDKLIRAGYLRQSQTGIFQLLPLGLRVQQKIEDLLDHHMRALGASRLSLSTITSEDLWRKSGRFESVASELFQLTDRKDTPLMLAPTHEEEITILIASTLHSYKDLPLRLYQTTRKYRDEKRPRHGLLRSREFLMKDLYTFDASYEGAIESYKKVSEAYEAFFSDLSLPIIAAEASSGDMGGNHSHEYHLANGTGEDTVVTCNSCGYAANDEVATTPSASSKKGITTEDLQTANVRVWRGITKDRKTLVNAWYPYTEHAGQEINMHAVRVAVPELDTSTNDPLQLWVEALKAGSRSKSDLPTLVNVVDENLGPAFERFVDDLEVIPSQLPSSSLEQSFVITDDTGSGLNLVRIQNGDNCPRCTSGTLQLQRALELGHTFYLGTRYSVPLGAYVSLPHHKDSKVPLEMGCYGIGVSRIFGAIAEHGADEKGLKWPRAIAPFEAVIVPTSGVTPDILTFYDKLTASGVNGPGVDAVLDDRKASFGWKMQDADMTGYPVTIVLGKAWREKGMCEVQCRNLSLKEQVHVDSISSYLETLFARL